MQIIWTSDLHLDRLNGEGRAELIRSIAADDSDALIIAGDIATAESTESCLREIHDSVSHQIYFVLGNHDYWRGTMANVNDRMRQLSQELPRLTWLTEAGVVPLGPATAMLGHEGWGDGRAGDYENSDGFPYDFRWIEDFVNLSKADRWQELKALGDRAAEDLDHKLSDALAHYEHVYLVTHVPPFAEACIKPDGQIFSDTKLPFYVCEAVGDLLLRKLRDQSDRRVTVLCGHTHTDCEVRPLENVCIRVRNASYGSWRPLDRLSL